MENALARKSLFSLEVFAEKLTVSPSVQCRLPALAFRLLDYPTLLIYHVEPELGETIRRKVTADPSYNIPAQFHELKDSDGNYIMKKGKSCLFKTTAASLHGHLCTTPLYIMLIDTYPDVPKLMGSFGVPLDSCMACIMRDIEQTGLGTPSTHGEKGDYDVYSMMGMQIGRVTMGFRLLSLGQGLLGHIPDRALAKAGATAAISQPQNKVKEPKTKPKELEDIMQDIEAIDKHIQVSISSAKPDTESQKVQTMPQTITTTQTEKRKPKARMTKPSKAPGQLDDIFITNVDCPPPLFYNSKAVEPEVSHFAYGLTLSDDLSAVKSDKKTYASIQQNDDDSYSDDDTIRKEDILNSSDEDIVDFKASKIYKSEESHYPPTVQSVFHRTVMRGGGTTIGPRRHLPSAGNLACLPILTALLQEILALQESQGNIQDGTAKSHQTKQVPVAWAKETAKGQDVEPSSPRKVGEVPPTSGRQTHRSCVVEETSQPVPKKKSWLRSQLPLGIKKSKLTYGITNTQRLRLAKANPELLKIVEQQEEIRQQNRKKTIKVGDKTEAVADGNTNKPEDAIRTGPQVPPIQIRDSMDTTADMSTLPSTLEKTHRRPKPTPRLSKQLTRDAFFIPQQAKIQSDTNNSTSPIENSDPKRQVSPVSRTQSIDIHLPSAEGESEDDATFVSVSDHSAVSDLPAFGRTTTLRANPALRTDSVASMNSVQYSDDFEAPAAEYEAKMGTAVSAEDLGFKKMTDVYSENEGSEFGEEPALRKVVDRYSNDEEDEGLEPELRKIVDKYSDEDSRKAAGEEPMLRQVVDQYSDSESVSKAESFTSAKQSFSPEEPHTLEAQQKKQSRFTEPQASNNSPVPGTLRTAEFSTTRTPIDVSSHVLNPGDSTAYLTRSQVLSETGNSESTGEWKHRLPRPSPRRKISSVHTESVSSYAPSEDASPSPGLDNDYSDAFEDTAPTDS